MGRIIGTIFILLQVIRIESIMEVYGYVGANVTLPSGVDRSWKLTKIEWSIFPNNTWIATYRNGKKSIERFYRYKGRLSLNTVSGDLTIYNLNKDDAMEYSVDLVNTTEKSNINKIKLEVRYHLKKPVIQNAVYPPMKGGCLLELKCSSADKGVNLTWTANSTDVRLLSEDVRGSSAVLLAFLNTTQNNVEFNCMSQTKTENASSTIMPKCNETKPPTPSLICPSRSREIMFFFLGLFLGGVLTALLMCHCGDNIRAAWQNLMEKLHL